MPSITEQTSKQPSLTAKRLTIHMLSHLAWNRRGPFIGPSLPWPDHCCAPLALALPHYADPTFPNAPLRPALLHACHNSPDVCMYARTYTLRIRAKTPHTHHATAPDRSHHPAHPPWQPSSTTHLLVVLLLRRHYDPPILPSGTPSAMVGPATYPRQLVPTASSPNHDTTNIRI